MYGNYRHIFKWGDPSHEEQLKDHVVHFAKEHFGMTDADFANKHLPGFDTITLKKRPRLSKASLGALKKIVGAENVSTEDFERAYHSAGKFYLELLKLRLGVIDNPPDAVVYPRDEKDVIAIVRLCNAKRIPITPFGGHSSVTRGVEPVKGGISLDLTRHMNAVIRVNEINSTVTVQPGMFGPALEEFLNRYKAGYTCGHFPQSFEFSTVGGWAVTRGAGQASTGYGKIEDMVLSMRTVTPAGIIETKDYPAAAIGPDIDQIIIGSEGAYGVVTEITMKIRTYRPQNTSHTSFVFKDFKSAVTAMRTVMQAEFGKPHLFRISDPEETEMAFRMGGKHGGLGDRSCRCWDTSRCSAVSCSFRSRATRTTRSSWWARSRTWRAISARCAPARAPRRSGWSSATRAPTCAIRSWTRGSSPTRWRRPCRGRTSTSSGARCATTSRRAPRRCAWCTSRIFTRTARTSTSPSSRP